MISAVMTTYNRLPYLKLALRTFKKHSMPDTELLIHVDGSTDGTIEWFKEEGIDHTYDKHVGALYGYNKSASRAKGDWLRIVNDDHVFSPGWDRNLLKYAGKDCALASRVLNPTNSPQLGTTPNTFNEETFVAHAQKISLDKVVPCGLGGAIFFSRERFEELGGFDEEFNPYTYGDTDFLLRLKLVYPDFKFLRCEGSVLYHFHLGCKDNFTEEERVLIGKKTRKYFIDKWGATPQEVQKRLGIR